MSIHLDTGNNPRLSYKPGDHVAIYPVNDEDLVKGVLHRCKDTREYWDAPMEVQILKERHTLKGKEIK